MPKKNDVDIPALMQLIGKQAKAASSLLAHASAESKNHVLELAATHLLKAQSYICSENARDIKIGTEKGLSDALLDRLYLDKKRIDSISASLGNIVKLDDPVGTIIEEWDRPNGLSIQRVRAPIGVIGVIFESRPNVVADAGAICLKAGNSVILRCGTESFYSCHAIMQSINAALRESHLPKNSIQLIPTQNRSAVDEMLKLEQYIDIIIPRGGKSLIKKISENCKIPQIKHLDGLCHTYIHENADPKIARAITLNAKMRRTGICGATETLLVDKGIAKKILPSIINDLITAGCKIRGDTMTKKLDPRVDSATEQDWNTEYLDNIIAIRQVDSIDQAILHIENHGSHHTDSIITMNTKSAEIFLNRVDSAIVMVNASTQFADGGEFGMGAEIGIGTGKLHARGPVGIQQLTSMKYLVRGTGQTRP